MLRMTMHTHLGADEVKQRAHRFFGSGGLGLEAEEANDGVTFGDSGSFVTLVVSAEDGRTMLDVSTREFDDDVRQFLSELGG
jgi:hypothetical protein